jgi:hypothetical protein
MEIWIIIQIVLLVFWYGPLSNVPSWVIWLPTEIAVAILALVFLFIYWNQLKYTFKRWRRELRGQQWWSRWRS